MALTTARSRVALMSILAIAAIASLPSTAASVALPSGSPGSADAAPAALASLDDQGANRIPTAPPGMSAPDTGACAAMSVDIHQAINPRSAASLVTGSPAEVRAASSLGFTDNRGVTFRASTTAARGLDPVYRLWHPRTKDFLWLLTERGRDNAVKLYGYQFSQIDFYASPEPIPCGVPVFRYLKGDRHRLAVSTADRGALEADGWLNEGAKFWAAPADGDGTVPSPPGGDADGKFTIALIPDSQEDVLGSDRLANRARWLVDNRTELDLRFVLHAGDVVNWDTPDHAQYASARSSLKTLFDAGIPTSLAVGNHDTAAVGVGGGAKPGGNARKDLRDTATFNSYFPPSLLQTEGTFEPDKSDNNYQLFSAAGRDWMIVTLEMWPRKEVVDWAAEVVRANPARNVIVLTHMYLAPDASIPDRRDYGATPPSYLHERLVSPHSNVKIVLSGHVGRVASRVDDGPGENRSASLLTHFHSVESNPIRLLEIDAGQGLVRTWIYGPTNDQSWPQYQETITGMEFR